MDETKLDPHTDAAEAFAALGAEQRLEIVRLLVRAGPGGMAVGALQEQIGAPGSTLSHHLKRLSQHGLLRQVRDGRRLICVADFQRIEELAAYLTRECCLDARPRLGDEERD